MERRFCTIWWKWLYVWAFSLGFSQELNIMKLLFSFPSEIFSLKPVFGARHMQFPILDHYILVSRHWKDTIRTKWTFPCVCSYECNDPELETAYMVKRMEIMKKINFQYHQILSKQFSFILLYLCGLWWKWEFAQLCKKCPFGTKDILHSLCMFTSFVPYGPYMVLHPMWVGTARSCVVLPGVNIDFRQILFSTQDLPEMINVWMHLRLVEYLADHRSNLEDSIFQGHVTTEPKASHGYKATDARDQFWLKCWWNVFRIPPPWECPPKAVFRMPPLQTLLHL